jgi:hypothetical protein
LVRDSFGRNNAPCVSFKSSRNMKDIYGECRRFGWL